MKLKIKKGDKVRIISGEEKGEEGTVLAVDRKKNRAIVEGYNKIARHTKPNAKNTQGGIVHKEAGIHLSNLMLIDNSGKPSRIGKKPDEKTGKLMRYSKNTGEVIK